MYIRKNHLTEGENTNYEFASDDGRTVHWWGSEVDTTAVLGTDEWRPGMGVERTDSGWQLERTKEWPQ